MEQSSIGTELSTFKSLMFEIHLHEEDLNKESVKFQFSVLSILTVSVYNGKAHCLCFGAYLLTLYAPLSRFVIAHPSLQWLPFCTTKNWHFLHGIRRSTAESSHWLRPT